MFLPLSLLSPEEHLAMLAGPLWLCLLYCFPDYCPYCFVCRIPLSSLVFQLRSILTGVAPVRGYRIERHAVQFPGSPSNTFCELRNFGACQCYPVILSLRACNAPFPNIARLPYFFPYPFL